MAEAGVVVAGQQGARRSGNVEATPLAIAGLLRVVTRRFGDARGFLSETYSRRDFQAVGIEADFVQDNHSLSGPVGTVRGLHFQVQPHAQAKLVRVVCGAILDVVVDLRRDSPTFGRHVAEELSAANGHQLLVPAGFAHGFCTLLPNTEISYKVDRYYAPECDRGLAWDDPDLGIAWPIPPEGPTLSAKDGRLPRLRELPACF